MNDILIELEKLDTQSRILKIKELIDEKPENISILRDLKNKFKSDFDKALIESVTEFVAKSKKVLKEFKDNSK